MVIKHTSVSERPEADIGFLGIFVTWGPYIIILISRHISHNVLNDRRKFVDINNFRIYLYGPGGVRIVTVSCPRSKYERNRKGKIFERQT